MSILRRLKTLLTGKPHFDVHPDVRIVPAFISGGVQYWMLEDQNNLLTGRAAEAVNFYTELTMKCTREFLIAHTEAIDKIVRNPKSIDIPQLAILNLQMKERLEMIVDSLTPYKVASVVYFDASENPYSFDYQYAFKKIAKWKKEKVSDFFLSMPIKDMIPSSLLSEELLETYMKVAREVDKHHYKTILDSISSMLSESETKKEWFKTLKLEESII